MRAHGPAMGQGGRAVLSLVLALAGVCFIPAQGAAESPVSSAEAPAPQVTQRRHRSRLEERVSALSKALELDVTQQARLTKVLEWQREQVRQVWNDPAVPPNYRVAAVHAISDETAAQIRRLLNEEQKYKYKLPRQPHPAAEGEGRRSVEEWVNAMQLR
jgi:hypothetical protein